MDRGWFERVKRVAFYIAASLALYLVIIGLSPVKAETVTYVKKRRNL